MRITESKLREMIRGVIREFVSTGTAAGAKKGGYQSKTRKSAQTDYDTKSADYTTKTAATDALASKKYRKGNKAVKGGYDYFSDSGGKGSGRSTNPDWLTKDFARKLASIAKDSSSTTLDTAKASDLQKTVPTQKPPSGGGAGFGRGKGKGKGSVGDYEDFNLYSGEGGGKGGTGAGVPDNNPLSPGSGAGVPDPNPNAPTPNKTGVDIGVNAAPGGGKNTNNSHPAVHAGDAPDIDQNDPRSGGGKGKKGKKVTR